MGSNNTAHIHSADRLEATAKESAKSKQSGNTRALLLQNNIIARTVRSGIGWALWIIESTWDALYRTLTLAARPQDIKNTVKVARNGIKTIFAEWPQVDTKWVKEYGKNLRWSKLIRDMGKQRHEPYLDDTKFYDTHGTDLSLAPQKSDHWFKKGIKGLPFIAGKVVKAPVWAASTVVGAVADSFRWMKAQKFRDMITLKFHKTPRNKTSHAWNKLTSRAYKWNTSWQTTTQEMKKEESDTSSKKSRLSRLRPFGKKKSSTNKESEIKREEKTPNSTKEIKKEVPVIEKKVEEEEEKTTEQKETKIIPIHTKDSEKTPEETQKTEVEKEISTKESNEFMRQYIMDEQRRLTKLYNNGEIIESKAIQKWIKSLLGYQKAWGEVIFIGRQDKDDKVLEWTLQSLIVEDEKVKVEYMNKNNIVLKDEISIDKFFDPRFSFTLKKDKTIDIKDKNVEETRRAA